MQKNTLNTLIKALIIVGLLSATSAITYYFTISLPEYKKQEFLLQKEAIQSEEKRYQTDLSNKYEKECIEEKEKMIQYYNDMVNHVCKAYECQLKTTTDENNTIKEFAQCKEKKISGEWKQRVWPRS